LLLSYLLKAEKELLLKLISLLLLLLIVIAFLVLFPKVHLSFVKLLVYKNFVLSFI